MHRFLELFEYLRVSQNVKKLTVNIQKLYKQHRKEVDDKMDNFMLPRETVQERRARVEALLPK